MAKCLHCGLKNDEHYSDCPVVLHNPEIPRAVEEKLLKQLRVMSESYISKETRDRDDVTLEMRTIVNMLIHAGRIGWEMGVETPTKNPAGRKIAEVKGKHGTVKVYRIPENDEYNVRLEGEKDDGYYTDDRDDAMQTAKVMAG